MGRSDINIVKIFNVLKLGLGKLGSLWQQQYLLI